MTRQLTPDHGAESSGGQSGHGAEHSYRRAKSAEGDRSGVEDQDVVVIFFYLFLFGYRYCPYMSTGIPIRLKFRGGYESHP